MVCQVVASSCVSDVYAGDFDVEVSLEGEGLRRVEVNDVDSYVVCRLSIT